MKTIDIWERLHNKLVDMSPLKHYDEIELIVGIIISGAKDRDLAFFSYSYQYYCDLAKLNSVFVSNIIDKTWYYIDNNIPFPKLEEDTDNFIDDDLQY